MATIITPNTWCKACCTVKSLYAYQWFTSLLTLRGSQPTEVQQAENQQPYRCGGPAMPRAADAFLVSNETKPDNKIILIGFQ